eukprot:CAMPEP_0172647486 /NCGR_PEP_ID=MMETSP1068-20121228/240777_1 /TAXON_ID=35684 /ORGANISM="Pseudopedinella elastica, Strain CCMP716" /LENGTH=71 /DNA_ID=CAMNT_0013461767 /DNA_START=696 /DNA_END=911 /DNA_ORIENTATION=-
MPFEVGELIVFVMIAVMVYLALVGVARALVFTYRWIYEAAREGAEKLETTVLDIGEVEEDAELAENRTFVV